MKDNVISFYEKRAEIEEKILAESPEWQQCLAQHKMETRRIRRKILWLNTKLKVMVALVIVIGIVEAVQSGNSNIQGLLCSMAYCIYEIATIMERYVRRVCR